MKYLLRLTTLGLFVSAFSSVAPAAEKTNPDLISAMNLGERAFAK